MKKFLKVCLFFLIVFIAITNLVSCAKPTDPVTDDIPAGFARIKGKLTLPNGITKSVANSEVYILGQKEYKTIVDELGNYELLVDTRTNGAAGRSIAVSRAGISDLNDLGFQLIGLTADSEYGTKADNITLEEGDDGLLPPITIEKTGTITGTVVLEGGADPTGTDVYIPGTSYIAKADYTGAFSISKVPTGNFLYIRAEKTGYSPKFWTNVRVLPDTQTLLDRVTLPISTGVDGMISIEEGANYCRSRTVEVKVTYSTDAFLMQVSEDPAFIGARWGFVKDSFTYTFETDGIKTLYVNFSDSNGLETKVSDSIAIVADPLPANLFPSDSVGELKPIFRWNPSLLPQQTFDFQLSSDPAFNTLIEEHIGLSVSTIKIDTALINKTIYYWRVRSIDAEIGATTWVSENFTVDLSVPRLIAPEYDTVVTTSKPTLEWDTQIAGNTYIVEISERADFEVLTETAKGITVSTYKPTAIMKTDTTYYWRVATEGEGGIHGDWGGPSLFYLNIPPMDASTPIAGASFETRRPVFTWNSVQRAKSYTIQISAYEDFSILALEQKGIIANSFKPAEPGLKGGMSYFWRVAYIDNYDSISSWSTPREFTIEPYTLTNFNPRDLVLTSKPTFSWTKSYLASETYWFQLSENWEFTSIIDEKKDIATAWYIPSNPMSNRKTHYWRVRSIAQDGHEGPWSSPIGVHIELGSVNLHEPGQNQTIYTATPTFRWSAASWAKSYRIQIAKDNAFKLVVLDKVNETTTYITDGILPDNCTLYWRVAPKDEFGVDGDWSTVFPFILPAHILNIYISFNFPQESTKVRFAGNAIYEMEYGGTIEVQVENSQEFTSFAWYVDGSQINDTDGKMVTGSRCTLKDLAKGMYTISLIAFRSGIPYDTQATVVVK